MTEQEILRDIVALPGYFTKPTGKGEADIAERNYRMVCDRARGLSFTELCNKYNLSEGRCRQIIEKMKMRYHHEFGKYSQTLSGRV